MIKSYADALFKIKRGFLIIGLTGYTGSGCSTLANILAKSKPSMPGLDTIKDIIDEYRYKRLKKVWNQLEWEEFVRIEISKIIFLLAIYCCIRYNFRKDKFEVLRSLISDKKDIFKVTKFLIYPEMNLYKNKIADKIVNAYEEARSLYVEFKNKSTTSLEEFIELMQNWGDEIRRYGRIAPPSKTKSHPQNILVLPEAIRRLIKAYRISRQKSYFVIDSFRNPFEVEFFRRRYNEFYLIAVQRDYEERRNILLKSLPEKFVKKLEKREKGKLIPKRTKENVSEWITSQNIDECLQKADYFLLNKEDKTNIRPRLCFHLIKLLALIKKPGCITPSQDERYMQLAISARQNSGCLSRHVGAVVVNKEGYVLGIGWNDPPRGQVSCLFRCAHDLLEQKNTELYSEYERSPEFIEHLRKANIGENPFCFREELTRIKEKKQAEYTRALHAEENALLQATRYGFEAIKDGTLYTTDCTCTLCAKKAYHLGIRRIVYIEEYPGISVNQTIRCGEREILVEKFEGVTGSAFFKLFCPLVPEKDFLKLYL